MHCLAGFQAQHLIPVRLQSSREQAHKRWHLTCPVWLVCPLRPLVLPRQLWVSHSYSDAGSTEEKIQSWLEESDHDNQQVIIKKINKSTSYQVFDGFLVLIYFSQCLIVPLDFINVLCQVLYIHTHTQRKTQLKEAYLRYSTAALRSFFPLCAVCFFLCSKMILCNKINLALIKRSALLNRFSGLQNEMD